MGPQARPHGPPLPARGGPESLRDLLGLHDPVALADQVLENLAGALLQKGEVKAAIESFRSAIKLAPRWPEAHYQFALALVKADRRDEAVKELRTALAQDPEHAGAQRELGRLTK